jgi:hypothetical protein
MRRVAIVSVIAIWFAVISAAVHGAPASAPANTPTVRVTCFDGAWSSKTTYGPGVVVSYNGANYMSLVTNTNDSPLSSFADWSILDASASKGPACPQGPLITTGGTPAGGTAAKAPVVPSTPGTPTAPAKPAPAPTSVTPSPQSPQNVPTTSHAPTSPVSAQPSNSPGLPQTNVISSVSIYDSPALPDVGGHSILGGLLTGKGFTAILPNLKVCAWPTGASSAARVCTEVCKPGHACLNQPFPGSGVTLGSRQSMLTVDVIDVDRPGSEHRIVTFNINPAKCAASGGASNSPDCKVAAPNRTEPNLSGSVQIGFNACQCLNLNDPTTKGSWNPVPGTRAGLRQQLTTKYAQVWTHFCKGKTLDGIMFKLFAGQIAPQNPNGTQTEECSAHQSNIIQFVNSKLCDADGTCPGRIQGQSYATAAGIRTFGDQWYLDTGGGALPPYLGPENFATGAHLVVDEPSVVVPDFQGKPRLMQKNFIDFVMCGEKIVGTIKWTRTGTTSNDLTTRECPARSRESSYDVEEVSTEFGDAIHKEVCGAVVTDVTNSDKLSFYEYEKFRKSFSCPRAK